MRIFQCISYNVPHGDDAHMVFLAMPYSPDTEDAVEEWFFNHVNEMTRKGGDRFMQDIGQYPPFIQSIVADALKAGPRTGATLRIQAPGARQAIQKEFRWYSPIVERDVVRNSRIQNPVDGYDICFGNRSGREVHVLTDVVHVSDKGDQSEHGKKKRGMQKEHLSPLEEIFEECIESAKEVLNEMLFMERREARMRHTADSTNRRVRFFSYISVLILLGVTYMQVAYLRGYFRKKKLL